MRRPFEDYLVDDELLQFVEKWEGFRAKAYKCPAGIWTIGYGHTADVKEGDGPVTQHEAEEMLRADLENFKDRLAWRIKTHVSKPQFIAIMSLVYNVGVRYLTTRCPKLMNAIERGDFEAAAHEFLDITSGGVPGLVRRRQAESSLMRLW